MKSSTEVDRDHAPRAIETSYGGHRFRSRLEARWAVFLDAIGIGWQYEWQGYELPSGPYLPDFWIPRIGGSHPRGLFVEVKGCPVQSDLDRCGELSAMTGADVTIVSELPRSHNVWTGEIECLWTGRGALEGNGGWLAWLSDGERIPGEGVEFATHLDDRHLWCACLECGVVGFEYAGRSDRLTHRDTCDARGRRFGADHPRLVAAYQKAAAARFEFGETPDPSDPWSGGER